MPINLTTLIAGRAPASITFDAGTLEVEFYPARLTTQMLLDISDATRLGDLSPERAVAVSTSTSATLAALLASWDLTETAADGVTEQPVPLDAAHIAALGVTIQWAILGGIVSAQAKAAAGEAVALEASKSASSSSAPS